MKTAELAVVGAGPAGLSAAITASRLGADTVLIDDNGRLGGQLIKQTHKFFGDKSHYCGTRGIDIATILTRELSATSTRVLASTSVVGLYHSAPTANPKPGIQNPKSDLPPSWLLGLADRERFFKLRAQSLIVATGAAENNLLFPGNDLPGVYGAGAVQTLMNVYGIRPGSRVLMVGSGNIGLIVSYQLIQAGIQVSAVLEALPAIGGYHVHAAKLVRLGVRILTSHTVKAALGDECVTGATICRVDKHFKPIPRTDRKLAVDAICLAVGLTPLAELLWQAECRMVFVPELGGHVAWHDDDMQTSRQGIYVAGDVSGIEEASTAMLEGRIAGARALEQLHQSNPESRAIIEQARAELADLRQGPFSERVLCGKARLAECRP